MKFIFLCIALIAFSSSAHAWDCSYWSQSSNPAAECYKAPATTGSNASSNATATAHGGDATAAGGNAKQGQHQAQQQTAQGGSADASNAGNVQSTSNYTRVDASMASISLPSFFIAGCGLGAAAGGGTPKGAGAFGIEFTTDECYTLIQSYADFAMGDYQTGCELLHSNKTHQKAAKRGAKIADCASLVPRVVEKIVRVGPTEEEVQVRIDAAIRQHDIINERQPPPCMLEKQRSKSLKMRKHMSKSNASLTCKKWEWVN